MERWSSWFKAPVLKTGDGVSRPWVRIPLFPLTLSAGVIPADLFAPVAQLDRASGYGPEGCGFELCRARHYEEAL